MVAQINLLPEDLVVTKEEKRLKPAFRMPVFPGMRSPVFLIGGILLVLVLSWIGLSVRISKQERRLSRIEEDWQKVGPLLREVREFTQQKKELGDRLVVLKTFLGWDLLWSEKLARLRGLIPEQIWLTALFLENGGKEDKEFLNIKGAATSLNGESMLSIITEFVGNIEKDQAFFGDFEGLELRNLKKGSLDKIDIMTFELILYLKER